MMFRERSIHKYYQALVVGQVEESKTIHARLVKDRNTNQVRILPWSITDAQQVCTRYTPLAHRSDGDMQHALTFLENELITGRTHQIRAHLASAGHPVVGDPKYGSRRRNEYFAREYQLHRQLLHAGRIVFPEEDGVLGDLSGREFTAKLPEDFERILRSENIRHPGGD
jgi:23S rRNA pseudouridine955/2504/2580 synthase